MENPLFSPLLLFLRVAQHLHPAFAFCFSAKVMDGYFAICGGDGDLGACFPKGGVGKGSARSANFLNHICQPVGIARFIIVPTHHFHHFAKRHSEGSVKNAGMGIA